MKYFPLFLDLDDKKALIVGGGLAAVQKLRLLERTGCAITVVAKNLHETLEQEHSKGTIEVIRETFRDTHLVGVALVYAASENKRLDAYVSKVSRQAGILVNVVDRQHLCDFLTPSVVDRSPLTVAISTEGQAPMLGRKIRAAIEAMLPHGLGRRTERAGQLRRHIKAQIPQASERRRFWTEFFANDLNTDLDLLDASAVSEHGRVSLVGAGPGDPELLTVKAIKRLQAADTIVIDRLVHASILDYARRDAEVIYAGKVPGKHSVKQGQINEILIERARTGEDVVRLKGGDPMVFARAAEEISALTDAGIKVEIVPGITAALGCAATTGLPLTSRGANKQITFITGSDTEGFAEHDWSRLAGPGQACVFYMGVGQAGRIQQRLLDAGIDPQTPVVIVENGTRADQKLAEGSIARLHELVIDHAVKGPALIYIGISRIPLSKKTGQTLFFESEITEQIGSVPVLQAEVR